VAIYFPLFISHSWSYSGHYDRLAEWFFEDDWSIKGRDSLVFTNCSVPKDDPIHNAPTVEKLKAAIYARIASARVVVIPTGMYANYSKWIQREIDGAKYYRKPILAVNPWASERKSSIVSEAADDSANWNKSSIVEAAWQLAPK